MGTTWRKRYDTKTIVLVAMARTRRKSLVFPGKSHEERHEKKKALRPKAARGMAVAVPRWLGKFRAASVHDVRQL